MGTCLTKSQERSSSKLGLNNMEKSPNEENTLRLIQELPRVNCYEQGRHLNQHETIEKFLGLFALDNFPSLYVYFLIKKVLLVIFTIVYKKTKSKAPHEHLRMDYLR